ncbi:MAG TPA: prolyl oligopeptidase family serine peptidase [Propionibacteriaceae bacterium]|nr:prolyl oligopeptidase family serine peptidase [Propionibacteriaceae bacterium]
MTDDAVPTEGLDLSLSTDETSVEAPPGSPWDDLHAYVATPRLTGLTLSHDGQTLVASVQQLNHEKNGYVSSLWRVDPTGDNPSRRVTRGAEGEAAAAFLRDGSLLFTSKRPVTPDGSDDISEHTRAIWCLPAGGGESYVLARRDGGWDALLTAADADVAVVGLSAMPGTTDEADAAKVRGERRKKKVAAILHNQVPIRYWDHDLGPETSRLHRVDVTPGDGDLTLKATDLHPITGDVGARLSEPYSLTRDGKTLVTGWRRTLRGGVVWETLALWDVATGERRVLESDTHEYEHGIPSPDGSRVAAMEILPATPTEPFVQHLVLVDAATLEVTPLAEEWDHWAVPLGWSPDGTTLYVSDDDDGDHAIFAIDVATESIRRLTGAGAFTHVQVAPDGSALYAVRSSYTDPGSVVRIDLGTGDVTDLRPPVTYEPLPGRMERIETTVADGTRVPAYLLLPEGASAANPAKLALWVHGGPLNSWNAWSWRWCPWLLVSQGYAVLLPDPALSTGYGRQMVARGWGQWGGATYHDIMAITDTAEARDDIDDSKTVMMGGSFGGYMANWIAGHTDRFKAIVSHASLWNLESFGPTTDAPWYWAREMTPEMRAAHSPHQFVDQITTPMLVIHGDKDYRVPIGEGLALWWALVSSYDGDPETMPHRFLYFPDENHWVLTPNHAIVWYQAVRGFLATHTDGAEPARPDLV